jgi:hypothetical protein
LTVIFLPSLERPPPPTQLQFSHSAQTKFVICDCTIERSNQDAKSEFGWDEFQATKLLAWEHQLALTILAHWFITETRLDWARRFQRDPTLLAQYEVEVLPTLSVANVRAMLRAALPLPQLSPHQAADLVVKHLDNRVRSRKSRLKRLASP